MARQRGAADSKIILSRKGAEPLLKTINGVSRKSYDASRKSRVSPATDDEPQSSSDDSDVVPSNTNDVQLYEQRHVSRSDMKSYLIPRQGNNAWATHAKPSTERNLRSREESSRGGAQPQHSTSNGRKRSYDGVNTGDKRATSKEDDLDIFGELKSSQPNRRVKTFSRAAGKPQSSSPKKTRNIFTEPREEPPTKKPRSPARTGVSGQSKYGTRANARKSSNGGSEGATFRMPSNPTDIDEINRSPSGSQPQFRMRSLHDIPDSSADNVPKFKVQSYGDSNTTSLSSSPLSSPPTTFLDSPLHFLDLTGSDCHDPPQTTTECPICSAPVSMAFYETFNFGRRLTIQEQAQVCRAHKRKVAEDEWRDKGYPTIDWDNFDKRLMQLHEYMQDVLDLKRPSFYRDLLEERIRSGRNRTMMQSLGSDYFEVLKPGYYGSRGARAIQEYITRHFFQRLRRLAASDFLISSGGVSSYIQCVLVPEVAIMLVKQDMKIPDEKGWEDKARSIMQESRGVGEELCEELEDRAEHVDNEGEDHVVDL